MTEQSHASTQFHLFSFLPTEIRLMIWESTWTEERIIELLFCEHRASDHNIYHYYPGLRPICSLSKWLQSVRPRRLNVDFDPGIPENGPIEKCPDPVALQVCKESRDYTLKTYTLVKHLKVPTCVFYLNPQSDILLLSGSIAIGEKSALELRSHYNGQLDMFRRALLECSEWGRALSDEAKNLADTFSGLRHLQVLLDDKETDDEETDDEETDDEETDDETTEDGLEAYAGSVIMLRVREWEQWYIPDALRLLMEASAILRVRKWDMDCIDPNGTILCQSRQGELVGNEC